MNTITLIIPPWALMWGLAFAMFFACKVLTWMREAHATTAGTAGSRRRPGGSASVGLAAAYFVAWPGMDPVAFFKRTPGRAIDGRRMLAAIGRVLAGAVLVWAVVPQVPDDRPLLAGWVGLLGLVLMLHFGTFDLLAIAWRARGADAEPLMNAPTRATSLGDFWGNRWNTAFNHLAGRYVFKPLRPQLGVAGATMATFLVSGVIHDLVISVPAGAGYGLPTLYFLIQGIGVLLERVRLGRRAGLGRGPSGRLFAITVVVAPLPWLFHAPFVVRVILPFLEVLR